MTKLSPGKMECVNEFKKGKFNSSEAKRRVKRATNKTTLHNFQFFSLHFRSMALSSVARSLSISSICAHTHTIIISIMFHHIHWCLCNVHVCKNDIGMKIQSRNGRTTTTVNVQGLTCVLRKNSFHIHWHLDVSHLPLRCILFLLQNAHQTFASNQLISAQFVFVFRLCLQI